MGRLQEIGIRVIPPERVSKRRSQFVVLFEYESKRVIPNIVVTMNSSVLYFENGRFSIKIKIRVGQCSVNEFRSTVH